MSYKEIFKSIYKDNRIFIRILLGTFSALGVFLFGPGGIMMSSASGLSGAEMTNFGGTIAYSIQTIATMNGLAIEPSITFLIVTIASICVENGVWFPGLAVPSFGLLDFWWARILIIVWAVLCIGTKCFQGTAVIGDTLEYINSKYVGPIAITVIMISNVFSMGNMFSSSTAAYAAGETVALQGGGVNVGGIILSVVIFVIGLAISITAYFVVRLVFFAIDVVMVPIDSLVPFASLIKQFLKTCAVVASFLLSLFAPEIFLILTVLLVVLCAFLFRITYNTMVCFKNLYMKPIWTKLFGKYDPNIPLVDPKFPAALREITSGTIYLAVPVYAQKKSKLYKEIKALDSWWLVSDDAGTFVMKTRKFGKKPYVIPLIDKEHTNPVYMKKQIFYNEIIAYFDATEKTKCYAFSISNLYKLRYDEMVHYARVFDKSKPLEKPVSSVVADATMAKF